MKNQFWGLAAKERNHHRSWIRKHWTFRCFRWSVVDATWSAPSVLGIPLIPRFLLHLKQKLSSQHPDTPAGSSTTLCWSRSWYQDIPSDSVVSVQIMQKVIAACARPNCQSRRIACTTYWSSLKLLKPEAPVRGFGSATFSSPPSLPSPRLLRELHFHLRSRRIQPYKHRRRRSQAQDTWLANLPLRATHITLLTQHHQHS